MSSILKTNTKRVIALILVCHVASGSLVRTQAGEPRETHPEQATGTSAAYDIPQSQGVEGVAVYYAKRFQGRRTNSGRVFDHEKLTAAHPSLPFGSNLKVINLANGKSVVVTVNDRCRKRGYEVIDLTRKAAQELGFYGKGSARVKIMPLPEE